MGSLLNWSKYGRILCNETHYVRYFCGLNRDFPFKYRDNEFISVFIG